MDGAEFMESIAQELPPAGLTPLLEALWWDKKGDWDRAHQIAQAIHSTKGSWVHAYLHRVEGDIWNARYWYERAGRPEPEETLEMEWERLVQHFTGPERNLDS